MEFEHFNQNIDCDVKSCKHCDYSLGKCALASIKIVTEKIKQEHFSEAFCANYEKKHQN